MVITPTRELEKSCFDHGHRLIAGMDEVGRGAIAGPVTVGVALVDVGTPDRFPEKLRDSKLLSASVRESLVEPVKEWIVDGAVGHASPTEIDAVGIIGALRLAGMRALAELAQRGHHPDLVLLDGKFDFLTAPPATLFDELNPPLVEYPQLPEVPVKMQIKGDANCAVIAAASVLAKVERDRLMAEKPDPGYGWAHNKGYGSADHAAAIGRLGVSDFHRQSWNLPGLAEK